MKLHILSDLHIEFAEFVPLVADADIVVLPGDIGVGLEGINWVRYYFPEMLVVYVPGNHEYYHGDISLRNELKNSSDENLHVLDNCAVELKGIRFVGSTLWTDFALDGEAGKFVAMQYARRGLKDFSVISNGGRMFTPEDSVQLHKESVSFLKKQLAVPYDGPTVIVTHHLPSTMSIAARFSGDPLNPSFASKLERLIDEGRPDIWVHGHTHESCDYEIFGARIVCNPRGYPGEIQKSRFQPGLTIEI